MGDVLKKFGRYFLLDHLAQGGMAEIYRARLAANEGAGRLLVIKRIQAGYGENAEFLQMFKSEIKVTMGFSHPNIVQLYDFGEENHQPYIAMELVDGKNLRQLMSRFAELKQTFPVELAAYVVEQAASGLNYAHSFRDKISGEKLDVVHRDISPQNILISFEGNVKVIDFGIAKATTNSESTRAGVIKGKPSYLSPEQISGEVLDGRSDLFALGAVLWELLTGKKLFAGESDLAVLKLIESCQTHVKPPSTLNPKIPKELDYIVLKTLTKQRERRYQTAEELQRALHKFLYGFMPEFNPSDLAYYAKDLFKNEIVEDRKRIQKLSEKAEALLQAGIVESIEAESQKAAKDAGTAVLEKKSSGPRGHRIIQESETSSTEKIEIEMTPGVIANRPGSGALPGGSFYSGNRASTGAVQTPRERARGGTSNVHLSTANKISAPRQRPNPSEGKKSGSSFRSAITLLAAGVLLVSIFGPGFGVKVPVLSDLVAEFIGGNEARLILEGDQKSVTVSVNGETLANALPATLTGIPVGTPFRVVVSGSAGTFQQDITLRKGEQKNISVTFGGSQTGATDDPNVKSVILKVSLNPAGNANITVNGRALDPNNPTLKVPLDQPLELAVERSGYKPIQREFVLSTSQVGNLKEWVMEAQLEPLKFGYLTIHSTPSADAIIMLDGTPWRRRTPIENEKFPIGKYTIRLSNELLGMEKQVPIQIQEGKPARIDERLEIKN